MSPSAAVAPFALLVWLALSQPLGPQRQAPLTYQGTVQAAQPRTREIDLLTGVGEALRVLHLRVVPATQITSGGRSATVADILPGDLIRADCHQTPQGLVVDRIEKLGRIDALGPPGASHP